MTTPAKDKMPRPPRFQAGLPARIEVYGEVHECRADNISRDGALLIGALPAVRGPVTVVTIESAGGDLSVSFHAHAHRHAIDPESGESTLGVEFLRIHSGDPATLEALVQRAMEGGAPTWKLEELPANASVAMIQAALERVPLPYRIQLAARGMPRERGMLMKDSHLQVIDALTRNPHMLLHEILTLLRMPRLLPHTLDAISKDSRWSGREQVRLMLAAHRNTTFGVAQRIITSLSVTALKKLLRSPGLKPAIQAGIVRRLGPGAR
jgi:hypothetical protein